MLQAHFEEKGIPFKYLVCDACKATEGAFHTHYKKSHWGHMDKPLGSRVNMTAQDIIPRHFIQVSMNGTEAGVSSDGP